MELRFVEIRTQRIQGNIGAAAHSHARVDWWPEYPSNGAMKHDARPNKGQRRQLFQFRFCNCRRSQQGSTSGVSFIQPRSDDRFRALVSAIT